jgi:hypothetical protein
VPITDVDDRRRVLAVGETGEHQSRSGLGQRVAQAGELAHPRAMHGMPGVAERAVDQLARILVPRQHDDRNRCRFGQLAVPDAQTRPGSAK